MNTLVDKTIQKLISLNLADESCYNLVTFAVSNVEQFILSEINPFIDFSKLYPIIIDIAIGEYLLLSKNSGVNKFILSDDVIKTIKEGDTSITYAIGEGIKTPEQRLEILIKHFLDKKSMLYAYKTIRW